MAVSSLTITMGRIKTATPESPLVVALASRKGLFKSFFYNTVFGHQFVDMNPPTLVGVFHNGMPLGEIENKLRRLS